jgi:phospholipid/cholesterol/gamma-HCH transport system substrate-binding protein
VPKTSRGAGMNESSRWSDVGVGAFVLAALGMLIAGSLWIAGSGAFSTRGESYTVLMKDSAGMQAGDRIRVAGVQVGKIRSVDLRPAETWPVQMLVQVRSDVEIHADSSASIGTAGLLGMPFLQIDPGSAQAPLLEPGGTIEGSGTSGINDALASVDELSDQAKVLLDQAIGLLQTVNAEITPVLDGMERMLSEQNTANVSALLENMNRAVEQSGPRVLALMERLDGLAVQVESALVDLPEMTEQFGGLVADLRGALGSDGERLAGLLESATHSFESADQALSSVSGNRHEIEATLADLRDATANLKSFTQLLSERPYSLVRMKLPSDRKPGDGAEDRK